MRSSYDAIVGIARHFFDATGIPVPAFLRRVHRASAGVGFNRNEPDLREEVAALSRAVERLETQAYIERIGHRSD
jgi:hypothetical protein